MALLVQVADIARRKPVGTSAVLGAVDRALRRRHLFLTLLPLWFAGAFGTSGTARLPAQRQGLLQLAVVAVVWLAGLTMLLRDDDRLLTDHRLAAAPPPSVWLDGA